MWSWSASFYAGLQTSRSGAEHGNRGRGVANERSVRVAGVRLGERDASAELERSAVHGDVAAVGVERFEVAHLDLDRGEAHSGGKLRVDGRAGGEVQERAQQTAMDHPDRVVRRLVRRPGKAHL